MRRLGNAHQLSLSLTLAVVVLALLPLMIAAIAAWNQRAIVAPVNAIAGIHAELYSDYREMISTAYELERDLRLINDNNSAAVAKKLADNVHAKQQVVRRIVEQPEYAFLDRHLTERLRSSFLTIEKDIEDVTIVIDSMLAHRELLDARLVAIRETKSKLLAAAIDRQKTADSPQDSARDMLRYWADQLVRIANTAAQTEKPQQLQATNSAYQKALRAAVFQLSLDAESINKTRIAGFLDALFELGQGRAGVFVLQDEILRERQELENLQSNVSIDIQALVIASREIASANTQASEKLLTAASSGLRTARNALVASAVIAILISLYVIRTFIQKRLVTRLRRLRNETRELAEGNLDATITEDRFDEIGELQRALKIFKETAVKLERREESLLEKTRKLEVANKELDDFAYVASHDLRAPLRSIDSLASFVAEDLGDDIPETTQRHLGLMRQRIARLESLLIGLLNYSRIGRDEAPATLVDLRALVEESVDVLSRDGFEVSLHGNFATIRTQRTVIEHIVRNLIDNAIKHHDLDSGKLRITCSINNDQCMLSIEDDGPGIEPQYHSRVFDLFQTLKSRDEVEGSGMGLTMLKKSAEHLGGTIHLESNPSIKRGARFILRWPVTPADAANDPHASPDERDGRVRRSDIAASKPLIVDVGGA